jgi:DNA-damage-inducible protein D
MDNQFESLKHMNKDGEEYWLASEFAALLGYENKQDFKTVLQGAMVPCEQAGYCIQDHFVDKDRQNDLTIGEMQEIEVYALSRLACYLIIQNADPSGKPAVALAQTYLASQTRNQELSNDSAIFQDHGYMGLYGDLKARDIHARKGLKPKQKILDYMGSTELAANLFRATQTDEQIHRENIKDKTRANQVHYRVGRKVRQTIQELGGTMPEDLPTPKQSVQQIQQEEQKRLQQQSQPPLFHDEEAPE